MFPARLAAMPADITDEGMQQSSTPHPFHI